MMFTVEPGPFLRTVEVVGEELSNQAKGQSTLHLGAYDTQVWVKGGGTVAETEAYVRQPGQCTVSAIKLARLLKPHAQEPRITVVANSGGLRIGKTKVRVTRYSQSPPAPESPQVFQATSAGVLPILIES